MSKEKQLQQFFHDLQHPLMGWLTFNGEIADIYDQISKLKESKKECFDELEEIKEKLTQYRHMLDLKSIDYDCYINYYSELTEDRLRHTKLLSNYNLSISTLYKQIGELCEDRRPLLTEIILIVQEALKTIGMKVV